MLRIEKTYAWIRATLISRLRRRHWVNNIIVSKIKFNEGPVEDKRVRSKWPAIIFAVSRTARVMGRIIFLIVSINTMKGIKIGGVPWGTKCVNIFWVCWDHPNIMKANHKGSLRANLMVKWAVLVKIYGVRLKKFVSIIVIKILIIKNEFFLRECFKIALISIFKDQIIFNQKKFMLEGVSQNNLGRRRIHKDGVIQFKDKYIEEEGSKIENKLFIIDIWFLILWRDFYLYLIE